MIFASIFRDTVMKLAQEPLKLVLQKQTFDQKVHLKSDPLYECLSNITLSREYKSKQQESTKIFFTVVEKLLNANSINTLIFKLAFLAKLSRIN